MQTIDPGPNAQAALEEVLGYLNFSSGKADTKFLDNLNQLFRELGGLPIAPVDQPACLRRWLLDRLVSLQSESAAFADIEQAQAVLTIVLDELMAAFQLHHRDLLYLQAVEDLWQPFLLGRMFEATLAQGAPWKPSQRVVQGAITQLCDYLGYRPVAVLETEQKIEPYRHEWVRPVPIYIEGAGVATGRYEALISKTLEILRETEPELLAQAWFDPDALEEMAIDPRAYDFDHPNNKRANYHFGQWDPHRIDNKGRYRRFVIQQVTLDALLVRVQGTGSQRQEEVLFEAAAVLAGTILMASGTSGSGPSAHDSTTTLSTLLPHIALYRDHFYELLLSKVEGPAAHRLRDEAAKLRQPFGGARQHLNQELAGRRAVQLQRVHLAQLFARMGYPEAAMRQARSVQVASARMLCEMYCRLTLGHRAIDRRELGSVAEYLTEIEDLLKRAIECGAMVDPWNIVGFGGNYSLFPALENSIHDFRVDTLIELFEQIFALCARAWSEAAAQDNETLDTQFSATFERLATWWDQYATPLVSDVKRVVGKELQVSTNLVAGALNAWHKAGAAAGDVGFWRLFVDQFDSPKAFQLVVEALIEKRDLVASMALLMQWLSEGERIALEDGDNSFHRMVQRWINEAERTHRDPGAEDHWRIVKKLFDYLEANAGAYWHVPQLDLAGVGIEAAEEEILDDPFDDDDDDDDSSQLYGAAYEEMVFRGSTDDGLEGDMLEGDTGTTDFELEYEAKRITERLAFLSTLARLWKFAASAWGSESAEQEPRSAVFSAWHQQSSANHEALMQLLATVHQYRISRPASDHDSLLQYDRQRIIKEVLLERIVATCVETADAQRYLMAAMGTGEQCSEQDITAELFCAVLSGDAQRVRGLWPNFLEDLRGRPLLYVPLARGGNPEQIVVARTVQQTLLDLLVWLPRLGLIREACQLLDAAQTLEREHPIGPGAVTEFDRLFKTGYTAIVECIVASSATWDSPSKENRPEVDDQFVDCLQQLTESQLQRWLRHSRTLRLSVVEKLSEPEDWEAFVKFVQDYGEDLFTQKFLNMGNIRAILHQGVDTWLTSLTEQPEGEATFRLLEDLDQVISRRMAVHHLSIALEAVMENYSEYRDYNSTTTQSDRGELLYTLIDFLRLRSQYDRVAWNLMPVVVAHEIMVQQGRDRAAELWRRALADRTGEAADQHVQRLSELSRVHGMQLPSISGRIAQRFIQPLAVDRMRALARPAMEEATEGKEDTFSLLEQETEQLALEPTGVGFDLPVWLEALEEEVATLRRRERHGTPPEEIHMRLPQACLSLRRLQGELDLLETEDEEEVDEE